MEAEGLEEQHFPCVSISEKGSVPQKVSLHGFVLTPSSAIEMFKWFQMPYIQALIHKYFK